MTGSPPPSRVLVVQAASVRIPGSPDAGAEFREMKRGVTGAPYGHALAFDSLPSAQASDLPRQLLTHVPAVLHFSGRGTPGGGLRFLTDDGGDAPVSHEGLRKLLVGFAPDGLQLVVLNACWSEELAVLLTEAVPCVIGTEGEIHDLNCLQYAGELYRALAHGRSVHAAHMFAVAAVEFYGANPSCLPELRTAPGVNADAVHVVRPEFRDPSPRAPVKPAGGTFLGRLRKTTLLRQSSPAWDPPQEG
ncbi:CHAT domain-containing protein [Streptomyces sp. NBC_01498]|uniref:hypothetical protein n=1 Tax=Streptomyces sp. NBC_01498 TaxID=2975870 RepID=UPI002E7C4D25|nr:hypothetical protein [Streptomyces sp. NBC_01498]WTL27247.1 CHAT domain-containing protein [Streptomyces sp. NBC_01498]